MVLFKDEDDEVLYDDVLLAAVDAAVSRQMRRSSQHAAAPAFTLPGPQKRLVISHPASSGALHLHQNGGGGGGNGIKTPGIGVDLKQHGRRPLQELGPVVSWVESHERPSSTSRVQEVAEPSSAKERDETWLAGKAAVSVFKECQDAALRILLPSDYMMMQGKPFIKKSGVGGSQTRGVPVTVERNDFRNLTMTSLAPPRRVPKLELVRICWELESTN